MHAPCKAPNEFTNFYSCDSLSCNGWSRHPLELMLQRSPEVPKKCDLISSRTSLEGSWSIVLIINLRTQETTTGNSGYEPLPHQHVHAHNQNAGWVGGERKEPQANYSMRLSTQMVSKHNDRQERIKCFHASVSPFILNGCHKNPCQVFHSEPESNGPQNSTANSKKDRI